MGTANVLDAAIDVGVKKIIVLSTDKAAYPINAMGISKAMMEKVAVAKSRNIKNTTICCTRYGNVMASRGSVIPLFIDQIRKGTEITITDPTMTRFMMSLDEAVELVLFAFNNGENGDIFVQKSPAATIELLANTIKNVLNKPDHPIKIIGTRHGEKRYETLLTKEEKIKSVDMGNYFKVLPDTRDLNYEQFVESGKKEIDYTEYNSDNTERLNEEQMKEMLLNLHEIQDDLKEFGVA